jgi:Rrf2 family cysteine metabolism transcriptional repressor
MRISAKTRYGLQALIVLGQHWPNEQPMRVQRLADRSAAPEKFLVQIFQRLRKAGVVTGIRGVGGGYLLAKAPNEIAVGELLGLLEGPVEPSGEAESDLARVLQPIWQQVDDAVQAALGDLTLQDLVDRWLRAQGPMYYI